MAKGDMVTVKVRPIEWTLGEHPKGELWVGRIGEHQVAEVLHNTWSAGAHHVTYSVYMLDDSEYWYRDCASIESGKRSAQRLLNQILRSLVA